MSILEILLISIGLAMDAFAVSICKGLAMKKMNWKKAIIIGLYFGIFQAVMPIIGYYLGEKFENLVTSIDHWIILGLLVFIGGNMIKESFQKENEEANENIDIKTMMILAIATSIDALAVGITFAFFEINLISVVLAIGIITFILSVIGVKIGNKFGAKYKRKSEFVGGLILILIGIKVLMEHLGII